MGAEGVRVKVMRRALTLLVAATGVVLTACGSTQASSVSARTVPALRQLPLTAQDRAAEAAFRGVDWSKISYPTLAPHCHVVSGSSFTETGKVVAYVLGSASPIALLTASCGINAAATANGIWAFAAPSASSSSTPVLLGTLVPLPPSPFQHDPLSSIFYFTDVLPGDTRARAIPSPPGTTTHSDYTAAGPVINEIGCYTRGPQFIQGPEFTVVGLTDPDLGDPDQPPLTMESIPFTLSGTQIIRGKRTLAPVARYECPQ